MVSNDLWFVEKREDLLQGIGKVTVRWAAMDLALANIATIILKNRQAALALIFRSQNAGAQRLECFKDVVGAARELDATERESLISLANEFKKLLPDRNEIVHSPRIVWFSTRDEGVALQIKGLSKSGILKDLADVEQHADDVGRLLGELDAIFDELHEKYDGDEG
ncbi:hypothetical protein ACK83U_12345 [Rhizobium sp. WW22]|uniref:hypothetical protein n=1 Tax=Rhizobium sp. WW22 TaxID=3389070 RepID=UPI000DD50735